MKIKSHNNRLNIGSSIFSEDIGNITCTCAALLWKLHSQGLQSEEIFQLVKDVINILEYGGAFTVSYVNLELEAFGWPRWIIDETSLELIIQLMENAFEYKVETYTVH